MNQTALSTSPSQHLVPREFQRPGRRRVTKGTGNGNKLGAGHQLSVLAMGARERNVNSGQYLHTRCIFIFIYICICICLI